MVPLYGAVIWSHIFIGATLWRCVMVPLYGAQRAETGTLNHCLLTCARLPPPPSVTEPRFRPRAGAVVGTSSSSDEDDAEDDEDEDDAEDDEGEDDPEDDEDEDEAEDDDPATTSAGFALTATSAACTAQVGSVQVVTNPSSSDSESLRSPESLLDPPPSPSSPDPPSSSPPLDSDGAGEILAPVRS